MEIEKLKEKIINRLGKVGEKTFLDIAIGWLGEERIFDELKDSIMDYEDIEPLEDLYEQIK